MVQQATRTHVVHMHMFMCMCADVVHVETLFRASTASPTRKRETEVRTTRHRTVPATCYTWPRTRRARLRGPGESGAARGASAGESGARRGRLHGISLPVYSHICMQMKMHGSSVVNFQYHFYCGLVSSFRSSQPPSAGHRHPRGGTDSPRRSPRGRRQASASRRPCLQGVGSSPESRRPVPAQR